MNSYPVGLPLPDHTDYSGLIDYGIIRSSVPASRSNQLQSYNSPQQKLSLSFSMDNDTYLTWLSWARTDGYYWFEIDIISGFNPVDITSTHAIRFIGDISYTKRGDNWLTVSVEAEMIPGEPQDPLS